LARQLKLGEGIREGIFKLVDIALAASPVKIRTSEIYGTLKPTDLIEAYRKRAELKEAITSMTEKANLGIADKLVIIIDELDRCRPDYAVRLLEQVKSLFQSENIITVVSTDSVQLAKAMAGVYGEGYDSQKFLERFFDYRVTLPSCDPFKVAMGKPFQQTSDRFEVLEKELLDSRVLTPRDVLRLLPKLDAAKRYASEHSRDDDVPFASGYHHLVANSAFLPLLIFVERENSGLFRSITSGLDFDSLYEEGKKYPAFMDTVIGSMGRGGRCSSNGSCDGSENDVKQYVHDLCEIIYSPNQSGKDVSEARQRLELFGNSFPPEIYKGLSFPNNSEGVDA
jgi:hypothetical protein